MQSLSTSLRDGWSLLVALMTSGNSPVEALMSLVDRFAAKGGETMQCLIRTLWDRLSGYNHGLRGIADRCSACIGGVIRVGLESAVMRIIYNRGWRGIADRCAAWVGGLIRVELESAVIRDGLGNPVNFAAAGL